MKLWIYFIALALSWTALDARKDHGDCSFSNLANGVVAQGWRTQFPKDRALLEDLLKQKFVDPQFTGHWLAELQAVSDPENLLRTLQIDPHTLEQLTQPFTLPGHSGKPIQVRFSFFTHPQGSAIQGKPSPNLVVLATFEEEGKPVAFWGSVLSRSSGKLESVLEYVKTDTTNTNLNGYSKSFMPHYTRILADLGVTSERVEAGWLGRVVWPKFGFVFDPTSAQFMQNGSEISIEHLVRENFSRFLLRHQIPANELWIRKESGQYSRITLSELHTPQDYMQVVHRKSENHDSTRVIVTPYIDFNTYGPPKSYDIGMAFTLLDYRPQAGEQVPVTQAGKPLSDSAMPTWIGYRPISQSPGNTVRGR